MRSHGDRAKSTNLKFNCRLFFGNRICVQLQSYVIVAYIIKHFGPTILPQVHFDIFWISDCSFYQPSSFFHLRVFRCAHYSHAQRVTKVSEQPITSENIDMLEKCSKQKGFDLNNSIIWWYFFDFRMTLKNPVKVNKIFDGNLHFLLHIFVKSELFLKYYNKIFFIKHFLRYKTWKLQHCIPY